MMDCDVTKFFHKSFVCLETLSSLDMRNSSFPSEKEVFEGCHLTNLFVSDLNFLNNQAFNKLEELESLSLESCKILLNQDIFLNKQNLKYLKLSNCRITILPDTFDTVSGLEDLDISNCTLRGFNSSTILKLTGLKRLALINNEVDSEIDYELFGSLPALETILFNKIIYNNIDFEKYPKLKTVQIPLKETSNAEDDLIIENLKSKNIEFEFISYGNVEFDMSNIQICA